MQTDSEEIDMIEKVKAVESIAITMHSFNISISELEEHLRASPRYKPYFDSELLDMRAIE